MFFNLSFRTYFSPPPGAGRAVGKDLEVSTHTVLTSGRTRYRHCKKTAIKKKKKKDKHNPNLDFCLLQGLFLLLHAGVTQP